MHASSEIIDLTTSGVLSARHLIVLNEAAEHCRTGFVRAIEQLGQGHASNVDWWVSDLASRNTFTSPLFTWCCQVTFIDRLLRDGESITEIAVDAWPLYRVLRGLVAKRGSAVRVRWAGRWFDRFAWRPRVPTAWARYFWEWLAAKLNPPAVRFAPTEPIVLVDTFVFDGTFAHGFSDRYYGGFGGYVSEPEWRAIWYWPTLHTSLRRVWTTIQSVRSQVRQFVLTEDVVTLDDLAYALLYPIRALSLRPQAISLGGIDITPLVRAVWRRGLTDANAVAGLLRYRFTRRLKARGVQVRRVIDWFENQSIDKGQNLGFRRYHPACVIVGYQGYIIPRHYLAMYPSQQEYDAGVVPHVVAVVGRGFVEERREFCPAIEVMVAPAFRFAGVWEPRRRRPDPHFTTVLAPLHMTVANSIDVLRAVTAAAQAGWPPNTRLWIRPHPAAAPVNELAMQARLVLPAHDIVADGDFMSVLEQADVLVNNTSSTCLEALAKGVPVAIVASANEPIQNPIPPGVAPSLWRVCFSGEDVAAAAAALKPDATRLIENEATGLHIRDEYFAPVTEAGVRELLGLVRTAAADSRMVS